MFVHSCDFVHKNIRPETIIVFKSNGAILGSPFLVGFEKFRLAEGQTYKAGNTFCEENLYRHPGRQGQRPEEDYEMRHDIYSLGVCLLEIGLWTSFVKWISGADRPVYGAYIEFAEHLPTKDARKRAFQIKKELEVLATSRLPSVMGTIYTSVVVSCLTCLDKDNKEFGNDDEFEDEDGIAVGVRYIEKVTELVHQSLLITNCLLDSYADPGDFSLIGCANIQPHTFKSSLVLFLCRKYLFSNLAFKGCAFAGLIMVVMTA